MLEIIALIFLTKEISKIAVAKGLKPSTWKIYTVLAWIAGEFIGAFIGGMIFGIDNIFSIILLALAGAITGYLIVKNNLSKKPDGWQDAIDNIGKT